MPSLEAVELTKYYASIPAAKDVTFRLRGGDVLGCLGPNGSGKSTTVKMMMGLLEPTRGRVLFDGQSIHCDLVGYRKQVGYVPEEPNLYPYLSGREYLDLIGTLRGITRRTLDQKINDLLDLFALHPHRHSPMGSYSKGMRQRILLIAALLDNPAILILDEPLSGLDAVSAMVVKGLIRNLAQMGRAIFYCSHVLEVVEKICTSIMILRLGNVIALTGVQELPRVSTEASLEETFAHLVESSDPAQISRNIIEVMASA
jgi:ABC-2 type transport system ATP-binding protein